MAIHLRQRNRFIYFFRKELPQSQSYAINEVNSISTKYYYYWFYEQRSHDSLQRVFPWNKSHPSLMPENVRPARASQLSKFESPQPENEEDIHSWDRCSDAVKDN